MKTVVGLYDRIEDAQQVVRDLREANVDGEDISIVARDSEGELSRNLGDRSAEVNDISDGTAAGAGVGAVLGGLGGLLVGLGALAIPGIGPVLAAGPLVSALAGAGIGAVTGGIVGGLVDLGIPEEHAEYYAEGVRRGGMLVVVRTGDSQADHVMEVMNRHNPVDIIRHAENWREEGKWTGFKQDAEPLPRDQFEFNRKQSDLSIPVTSSSDIDDEIARANLDLHRREDEISGAMDDDHDIPVTGGSFFGQDSEMLDREDMPGMDVEPEIPATGASMDVPLMHEEVELDREDDLDPDSLDVVTRPHYQGRYASSGRDYAYYLPAYRFGHDLAKNPRYRDAEWPRVEQDARMEWMQRGFTAAWEDVKDAVHHAWNELRY